MSDQEEDELPAELIPKDEEPKGKENTPSRTSGDLDKHLPNTKKYLPKANTKRVIIPFVIPWENTPAKESQKGMRSFGTGRDPKPNVDMGSKEMKQGELNSESILTLFAEHNKYASQKGMRSFGAHRVNISKFTSSKEIDPELLKSCEGIIPKQAGKMSGPSQSGDSPMGAIRLQVPRVHYQDMMSTTMDPESESFISKLLCPNPANKAGTSVIDRRRNQVPLHPSHTPAECVPKLWDTKDIEPPTGTGAGISGLGPRRQVITKDTGGYDLLDFEIKESKKIVPYQMQPSLTTTEGTGGFSKIRDVVNHSKY